MARIGMARKSDAPHRTKPRHHKPQGVIDDVPDGLDALRFAAIQTTASTSTRQS